MKKESLLLIIPYTFPVLAGFMVLGITYGLLMSCQGFSWWVSFFMSSVAFCGSMQFAAIPLLLGPFLPLEAFFLSLLVNARHFFYGLSLLEQYKGLGKIKGLLIFLLCDETFSLVTGVTIPTGISKKKFYTIVSLLNYSYWVIATLIGSLIGSKLTISLSGLEFVLTALFVVLFLEQWKNKENRLSAMIGIFCTVVSLLIFGSKNMVIPAMILILIALVGGKK